MAVGSALTSLLVSFLYVADLFRICDTVRQTVRKRSMSTGLNRDDRSSAACLVPMNSTISNKEDNNNNNGGNNSKAVPIWKSQASQQFEMSPMNDATAPDKTLPRKANNDSDQAAPQYPNPPAPPRVDFTEGRVGFTYVPRPT